MAGSGAVSVDIVIKEGKDGLKRLIMDADGLRKIMESNIEVAQRFEKKVFSFAALATSINAVSNAFGQLASTLQSLTGESESFNRAMKEANTMAGKDGEGFKQLKGEIAELAKEIPIARDLLANGLYQTISNGVPEGNWIEYLKTSARSAVGGLADINKVVGVTSTIIKNYGLEWGAAADIQDKIQLTAKNGVTSFEQLAQALPRVTGNAATLGVTIDELMGSFATLTGVSGNTAEVSTQLAAIFTSLVKPSSEAAEMAAEMGIQFDAAAIKAAGGFQNFLSQLDRSVKAYAQASGALEQEVYGKLFGSAEALRALIPLQGELADKFADNVAGMVNSAGTMDAAYEEMGSTGEAVAQKLKNQWASVTDAISNLTSKVQPFLNFSAGLLSTASNATILAKAFNQLNALSKLRDFFKSTKDITAATAGLTKAAATARLFVSQLGQALMQGTKGMRLFVTAWKGMLVSTGIGIAIAAVTSVLAYFAFKADEAAESIERLDDATDDYVQAAASALVQIESDAKSLGELIKANEDTTEAVQHLNETYGELLGTRDSAVEWYTILTEKSKLYAKQIGYEAQARSLASKIAEASIKRELAAKRIAELKSAGVDSRGRIKKKTVLGEVWVKSEEYEQATKDEAEAAATEAAAEKALTTVIKLTRDNNAKLYEGLPESNGKGKGKGKGDKDLKDDKTDETLLTNPKTKDELLHNANILSKRLTGENNAEQQQLVKDIALYREKISAIELAEKAASRPTEINTLEDIGKELSYQQALRQRATAENIAGIDAEINRLEELRGQMEHSGHTPIPTDKIQTYAQLKSEVSYYDWALQNGTEQERIFAQQHLNDLNELKKAWDSVLDDLKKPGDISTLDTIEKLDEAISYYQQKQKKSTDEEIQNIQETIDACEEKRKALQRGIEIPSMLREAAEINKLTGREYKVKISSMGFDELTAKINELNRMLNDTDHPVTASQREDIESLIATYEKWRKEGVMTFDTFRSGYGSLKGIGSGVESITAALEGNGNAWQTVTGIVDGFLQIYDGIKTIVGIINMLSTATTAHTTAKAAESAAIGVATGAQTAEAIAAEATALAQTPVIAANKLAAASYMELASAAYFAAHAYIPFAGFGIASGFVTAATAMVQAIGVMPFANGGIVSGPTVGLIGEYAGASSNPEVIAPLDKLRGMLGPAGQPVIIGGTLRASGRDLVCVLANETRIAGKSGRKTNIKL